MIFKLKQTELPTIFNYILYVSFIEICFSYIFRIIGLQVFQMIPYLRLVSVFSTFFFFNKGRYIKANIINVNIKNNLENKLVLIWLSFTIISFLIGVIKRNSIVYLFSDAIYIFFGYFLYRIFLTNESLISEIKTINRNQEKKFIFFVVILSLIALFLKVDLPTFFIVFSISYSLYFFGKKKYLLTVCLLLPFLLQIVTSGRALLFIFLLFIFFSATQNKFSKKSINQFLTITVILLSTSLFFIVDVLNIIIDFLPQQGSTLKDRLVQIMLIFEGKANWNSPNMLSLAQRFHEAKLVLEFWLKNPFNFLFGGGLGATIEGFAFKDVGVVNSALLGKASIHNIHLLPFSLIFRYGILGIYIFIHLLLISYNSFIKILLFKNTFFKALVFFQFSWILYSIPAASYLWTCPLFWITLAYLSNEKKIFNS
jgi:hypothetical protein